MQAPPTGNYLDPAYSVVLKFAGQAGRIGDGVKVVAKITGVSRTQVYRWMYRRSKGGTDGMIPIEHAHALRDWARKSRGRVDLAEKDFFGSSVRAA